VTGFGEHGLLAPKPGFDPMLQAMSGMMRAQGGDGDPVLLTIPVNDIAAAAVSVLGICLGLFHRVRHGTGQRIWTSLLACSTLMQSGELVRYEGRTPAVRGGRDFPGPSALDRFYRVTDGWLRLQAPGAAALIAAGVLQTLPAVDSDAELALAIAERLATRSLAEALESLSAAGIPAAPARQPSDLVADPDLRELDMFTLHAMLDGTPFYMANRFARFSRTQEESVFVAPGVGEHSREVLDEAGVNSAEIDALIAAGVVNDVLGGHLANDSL